MSMSTEQKQKQSERMKAKWAEKKKIVSVEEATDIVNDVINETGGELPSTEEMTRAVLTEEEPEASGYEFREDKEEVPTHVVYVAKSRNFKLALADHLRGRTLVDGSRVRAHIIKFRGFRYTSKSLDERKGIEKSPSFKNKFIEILMGGIEPLYPEEKRQIPKSIRPEDLENILQIKSVDLTPEIQAGVIEEKKSWSG